MKKKGNEISCFITIKSENKDSYMFHTPNIELAKLQARASGVPIIITKTKGIKEEELKDLKRVIKKAKEEYSLEGITTGALYSNYQKKRIEKVCEELNLKVFSPLWHMDQEQELKALLKNNFKVIIVSIAAEGLDKSWINKELTKKEINELVELNKQCGINPCGEGGEYESLVLDCPLFNKRVKIIKSKLLEEDKHTARLIIKKAELVK